MADKTGFIAAFRQRSFDQTGLICECLTFVGHPGGRAAISEQINSDKTEAIFQIAHQSAPLMGAGSA
jgi:hypothetical protein